MVSVVELILLLLVQNVLRDMVASGAMEIVNGMGVRTRAIQYHHQVTHKTFFF